VLELATLISRQARLRPDAPAVVFENQRLTYREFWDRVARVGNMLRALGIDAVRLLTNNPAKLVGLGAAGIAVVERVAHHMPVNPHNADYVATKQGRSGHLL